MSSYKDKLETLNENDKILANSYFTKAYKIENMFEIVRTSMKLKDPIGNFNSEVVCILDYDKVNDKVIRVIQKFYEINNGSIFNAYITSYNKTSKEEVNTKLLTNELLIISPKRVLVLGASGVTWTEEIKSIQGSMWISKEHFDTFIDCIGDKEKMETEEYKHVKQEFNDAMKFMIIGV